MNAPYSEEDPPSMNRRLLKVRRTSGVHNDISRSMRKITAINNPKEDGFNLNHTNA